MTPSAIIKFTELTSNIGHGNGLYTDHCMNVYAILRELGAPEQVCLAGLYHSIYGNEYFNPNIIINRESVKQLIGEYAESLVYMLCSFSNLEENILSKTINCSKEMYDDLFYISYANLKEQSTHTTDVVLLDLLARYEKVSNTLNQETVDKQLIIFDDLIERSHLDLLNTYCLNSKFTCDHASNQLNFEIDSRFVSGLTRYDFLKTNLFDVCKAVGDRVGMKLTLGNYYINHYTLMTPVSRHTDSSLPNTYTILVNCNKFWDDDWGGEIKFYNEFSNVHKIIDFVPGRVIFFDSRIEHKVMPLSPTAKKSRFTIAIKCSSQEGLDNLKSMYGTENLITL
jgi:hypothetical protein